MGSCHLAPTPLLPGSEGEMAVCHLHTHFLKLSLSPELLLTVVVTHLIPEWQLLHAQAAAQSPFPPHRRRTVGQCNRFLNTQVCFFFNCSFDLVFKFTFTTG